MESVIDFVVDVRHLGRFDNGPDVYPNIPPAFRVVLSL
jgi:hypothetical protein